MPNLEIGIMQLGLDVAAVVIAILQKISDSLPLKKFSAPPNPLLRRGGTGPEARASSKLARR